MENTESKETKPKNDSKTQHIGKDKISAEARGITVQGIIDQVPENSKFMVLSSLVSSIACSIIGTASTIVGRFERMENVDLVTLERSEILHMMVEADMRMDLLRNTRSLMRVREVYADQLLAVSNNDEVATWASSIEFMTQPGGNSRIQKPRLIEAFKACGIDDENVLETMYQASLIEESNDRVRNAEQIAARRGGIEWLIENIFTGDEYIDESGKYATDTNIVSRIEELPDEIQDRLYDKIRVGLNKALTRAASRFALGDTRYEIGDVVDLNLLVKEAKFLDAFSE